MVLNDIIEQAAGRHSRASEHGGECEIVSEQIKIILLYIYIHFIHYLKCLFYIYTACQLCSLSKLVKN
jgi:hypothetical protein